MGSSTSEFWKGEFGDEYTKRNRVNWLDRVPFWTEILAKVPVSSVLEFGCNVGWNLLALRLIKPNITCWGVEINESALKQANNLDLFVHDKTPNCRCDLVFTAGVLIHVSPEEIDAMIDRVIEKSSRYVLAVEYNCPPEHKAEEVMYRGHEGKLWRRPYGELYQAKGLTLIETGVAEGFDDCTYWLLKRTN